MLRRSPRARHASRRSTAAFLGLVTLAFAPSLVEAQIPDKIGKASDTLQTILERAKRAREQADSLRRAAPPEGGAPAAGAGPATATGAAATPSPAAARSAGDAAAASIQPGSAKVEELIVAPNEQDLNYSIHPGGSHLAAVVRKGSRYAVMWDGVVGPAFDRINSASNDFRVAMSPDGKRFGYVAISGSDYVVMVDGKEVRRAPHAGNPNVAGGQGLSLHFTPNSRHYHFQWNGSLTSDLRGLQRIFFWDGVAGPPTMESEPVISPDGERHAYNILNPANGTQKALVIDGKVAPYVGFNPVFTADGKHLFTTRDAPPAAGGPTTELLLDGRPVLRAASVAVHVPPVGDRVVLVIGRYDENRAVKLELVVGGQRVPGSTTEAFPKIAISPDGRRYAAIVGMNGRPQRVLIDGKLGQQYDAIDTLRWSPDSRHAVYTARSGANMFAIVDHVETEAGFNAAQPLDIKLMPNGRVGWIGHTTQGPALVVDGKITQFGPRVDAADFSFSPDGARYAHVVGGGAGGGNVAIDNVLGPPSMITEFAQYRNGDPKKYIWSPNGKYTLHYGAPGAQGYQGEYGFMIGGRYVSQGKYARATFPTFTPDSRHLFWIIEDGNRSVGRVFLDGRPVYEFDERGREPLKVPGGWTVDENGVLTFFIQTVEGFKRVRITPGAEDGVEAFVARGRPMR